MTDATLARQRFVRVPEYGATERTGRPNCLQSKCRDRRFPRGPGRWSAPLPVSGNGCHNWPLHGLISGVREERGRTWHPSDFTLLQVHRPRLDTISSSRVCGNYITVSWYSHECKPSWFCKTVCTQYTGSSTKHVSATLITNIQAFRKVRNPLTGSGCGV